jgi:dTDP-4-dehydrorhamnose reductase
MNRVYIAGCGGMLGSDVYNTFSKACTVKASDVDVNESWLSYADVRDKNTIQIDIESFHPDLIINLAALTDLEYCEINQSEAHSVNRVGAENLSGISQHLQIPYVYISTAGIFGGKKDVYTEDDTPNPTSVYGKTKFSGEQCVLNNNDQAYVFRAGWMMGGKHKDKKFVGKILKQIDEGVDVIYAVSDKHGTPTYTLDFAECMYNCIVNKLPYGLYNMVCDGRVSRLDVAREIVHQLKLDIPVKEVQSNYFIERYPAPRPACEALVNKRLEHQNQNIMRDWKECLGEYLSEW